MYARAQCTFSQRTLYLICMEISWFTWILPSRCQNNHTQVNWKAFKSQDNNFECFFFKIRCILLCEFHILKILWKMLWAAGNCMKSLEYNLRLWNVFHWICLKDSLALTQSQKMQKKHTKYWINKYAVLISWRKHSTIQQFARGTHKLRDAQSLSEIGQF